MKKFKKLVIGGIESKIVALILIAILLVSGVFLAVILTQNKLLTHLTEETTGRQLLSMTGTTSEVIDTVIEDSMGRSTELEAQVTDKMFRDLAVRVQIVGEYAGKLLSDPGSVTRMPWARPDASRNGELFVKVLLADGVEESDIKDRLGLIANLSDMMVSLCRAYGADNIWFSTPDGATLMADTVPGKWIREDGSYVTYDAVNRYWYKQAVHEGKLIFSDIEIDKRTGEMCVTCAMPVFSADGKPQGVAGADLFLDEMQRTVAEATENGGNLVAVNQNGHVIISPSNDSAFKVLDSAQAVDLRKSDNAELAALVSDSLSGKTDVRKVKLQNGNYYMIGVPMKTVGWALIAAYSEEDAAQPVRTLEKNYHDIQQSATSAYRSKNAQGILITLVILIILLIALLAGALAAGKRIVKPLNSITRRIAKIKKGNLEFRMADEYRTGDEVEVLAQSFADLSHKVVEYIDQIKNATAEKERIITELHMAHQIQEGMLPNIFPPYPGRSEFDLYATMNPAKEVGGDFYDYFLIDDDHLALVIADVSDKGIPAALFMMVSKAIIKNNAMMGKSAGEILSAANETICSNNKMQMFVTVWLGIMEISTGRIIAANAGHEYPVISRNGGSFELYKDKHSFVVGGMEGIRYKEYELNMQPGDKLFLYTDGVPEAVNCDQELFGTERMIAALNTETSSSPQEILTKVHESVDAFAENTEQFDDLTMLYLEYKGNPTATKEEKTC